MLEKQWKTTIKLSSMSLLFHAVIRLIFLVIISGDVDITSATSGLFVGRISEGQYEYSDLNGWMTPRKAIQLCEMDMKCGGFTYKVKISLSYQYHTF